MASCRDCPCDSASCRDSRQEAKSHGQSLQEAISQALKSSRKQEIAEVSAKAKYDVQSLQEAKIGGLVYTLWFTKKLTNPLAKLRSIILKLGFRNSWFQNLTYSNKTVHGDKAQFPLISHQGLEYLSLLPDAAVTCTKQQI